MRNKKTRFNLFLQILMKFYPINCVYWVKKEELAVFYKLCTSFYDR